MLKKAILFFMKTKLYKWLIKDVIPLIRFSVGYAKINGKQYQKGYSLLKPGHIVLLTDEKKLTSFLIPGDFSHAALCVGKYPDKWEIVEMTRDNFTKSHFFDLCKEADRVVILECVDFTDPYIERMIEKALDFEGAKYDSEFTLGVDALYCSELIYQADFARFLEVDLSDLAGLGRPYLSPDGLYQANNVRIIWDSKNV